MPTIHDVARKANVSIASVSLVMNNPETARVGAVKRKIILDAANQLGYSANGIAKALIHGETKILGLVVPMRDPIFFNHFIAQVLSGIQAAIKQDGYHLMIYSHQAETGRITAAEVQQSRFADGLIVLNTRMCTAQDQKNTIETLTSTHIPFAMANCYTGNDPINYVGLDDYQAGCLGGEYLAKRKCHNIALISGAKSSPMSRTLLDGFKASLKAARLKFNPELHVYSEYDSQRIRSSVSTWLKLVTPPDAIFCADDQFAPDVYAVLQEFGLKIPGDVAVLGRGDMMLGTAVVPKLSTIAVPGFQMGKQAAELLIRQLRNRTAKPKRIILPCTMVPRESA